MFLLFKWRRKTKFSVFTLLFLSLSLSYSSHVVVVRAENPARESSSLKRSLFFFLSSFEQRSSSLLLLFCSDRSTTHAEETKRAEKGTCALLFCGKTHEKNTHTQLVLHEKKKEKKKESPTKTRTKNNTSRFTYKKDDDGDVYILLDDDDAHERSALLL